MPRYVRWTIYFSLGLLSGFLAHHAVAHDDGRFANSPLKSWFDKLASGKGLCCSVSDGRTVEDPDWGTDGDHYWVRIDGKRLIVPDDAVVSEPNIFGRAVVWPITNANGDTTIRCFLAGTEG